MELRSKHRYGAPPNQSIKLPLTQQNLQPFGYQIPDIESDKETVSSDKTASSTTSSTASSTASSTDPMLPELLHYAGVRFQTLDALAPDDKEELLRYLSQERNGPTEGEARDVFQRLTESYNEEVYKSHFVSVILNPSSRRLSRGHSVQMDLGWTAVKHGLNTVVGLQNPKPDYFETINSTQYPLKARNALGWSLFPCLSHPVVMPTFCVEFKSPEKGSRNAITQAAHDGAIIVHAAWERHKYMKKPANDFFRKTKALVIAIADNSLDLFACHAIPVNWDHQSNDEEYPPKLNYHIFKLAESRVMSEANLKTVYRLVHNAQDWCRSQIELVKKDLWKHFEELEKKEVQSFTEDREMYSLKSLAIEAKRKAERANLEQQDRPIKRRRR